jgi:hypothetical protein
LTQRLGHFLEARAIDKELLQLGRELRMASEPLGAIGSLSTFGGLDPSGEDFTESFVPLRQH